MDFLLPLFPFPLPLFPITVVSMTCPRISPARELYGIIGTLPNASQLQAQWNRFFASHGMDAFMDKYPTTKAHIPERLSEMFHFDRRLYLVGADLQEVIVPFLDASEKKKVDTVLNRGGVLHGKFLGTTDPAAVFAACGLEPK